MQNMTLQVCVGIDTDKNSLRKYYIDIPLKKEISLKSFELMKGSSAKVYYYEEQEKEISVLGRITNVISIQGIKKHKKNKRSNEFCILEQIADITSRETAITLAKNFGGIRIYIPKKAKEGNVLVELIGGDNLEKIIQEVGCGYLIIPARHYRGAGLKAQKIFELLEQKKTVKEIAVEVGCCERTVWLHKQKMKQAKQNELQGKS